MNASEVANSSILSAEASSLDFRQILKAMSYPGKVCQCFSKIDESHARSINRSAQQIAHTLVSREVSVSYFLQQPSNACKDWIRFILRSRIVTPEDADFLFVNGTDLAELDLQTLPMGTSESPQNGITLLVSVDDDFTHPSLRPLTLTGPGVNPNGPPVVINLDSVSNNFFQQRQTLAPLFPLGIDVFFCAAEDFIALPRTTQVNW